MTERQADAFSHKVVRLIAGGAGFAEPDVEPWLQDLPDRLHRKLAKLGLVKPRAAATVAGWCSKYIESRKDLKRASLNALTDIAGKLVAFLGESCTLRAVTPNDASEWRAGLAATLAVASVKHHVGNAKGLFAEAKRRGLIMANPFEHLRGGSTAAKNDRCITAEEVTAILGACTDLRWKLAFAIPALAGVRCPSESHLLTWGDVDWERRRLRVRSPKTERHEGHGERWVPVVPQLMDLLEQAFDVAPEGQTRIIADRAGGYLRRMMRAIVKRAGVTPWARLWQTLRSSCEKRWAAEWPQLAVSQWIGHSLTVSGKHYVNGVLPDGLWDRITKAGEKAAQNPAQHVSEWGGTGQQRQRGSGSEHAKTPAIAGVCASVPIGADSPAIGATTAWVNHARRKSRPARRL
jgi:integrase